MDTRVVLAWKTVGYYVMKRLSQHLQNVLCVWRDHMRIVSIAKVLDICIATLDLKLMCRGSHDRMNGRSQPTFLM